MSHSHQIGHLAGLSATAGPGPDLARLSPACVPATSRSGRDSARRPRIVGMSHRWQSPGHAGARSRRSRQDRLGCGTIPACRSRGFRERKPPVRAAFLTLLLLTVLAPVAAPQTISGTVEVSCAMRMARGWCSTTRVHSPRCSGFPPRMKSVQFLFTSGQTNGKEGRSNMRCSEVLALAVRPSMTHATALRCSAPDSYRIGPHRSRESPSLRLNPPPVRSWPAAWARYPGSPRGTARGRAHQPPNRSRRDAHLQRPCRSRDS